MRKKIIIFLFSLIAAASLAFFFFTHKNTTRPLESYLPQPALSSQLSSSQTEQQNLAPNKTNPEITFVGPRKNIAPDAPKEEGFWSFAVTVPNVLSRSGQPTLSEFQWLKDHGWKGDVDLRINGDHGEQADDAQIPGFSELGFSYLHLQMVDGAAPTDQQAQQFLQFVTNSANLPVHVHCRGGIGRAGTMVALYRYSVQGWPMDKAIEESQKFSGGVSSQQKKWLLTWAQNHPPASYIPN